MRHVNRCGACGKLNRNTLSRQRECAKVPVCVWVCVCESVYLMDALEYFALLLSGRAAAAQAVSSEQNYNWNWISIFNALCVREWVCEMRSSGCQHVLQLSWLDSSSPLKQLANLSTLSSTQAQHQLSHIDRSVRGLPPLHILLHFNDTSTIECANLFAVFSYFSIYTYIRYILTALRNRQTLVVRLSSVIQILVWFDLVCCSSFASSAARFDFDFVLVFVLVFALSCCLCCVFFSNYKPRLGFKSCCETNGSSLFTNRVFLIVIYIHGLCYK